MKKFFEAYATSHIGLRKENEDAWVIMENLPFFALADGLGGHLAGGIAAKETLAKLRHMVEASPLYREDPKEFLKNALNETNSWIHFLGRENEGFRGMGSTLCCAILEKEEIIYAHVGDSRLYRFSESRLEQLTRDHLTKEKLKGKKPSLAQAIGPAKKVTADINSVKIAPNDVYLICSDGLTDTLSKDEMEKILNEKELSLQEKGDLLIKHVLEKNGADNITLILLKTN